MAHVVGRATNEHSNTGLPGVGFKIMSLFKKFCGAVRKTQRRGKKNPTTHWGHKKRQLKAFNKHPGHFFT
jgi:hypothetical protein